MLSELYETTIKEVKEDNWWWNGINLHSKPLQHSKRSVGYTIEADGKKIAFSGDTGYCKKLVQLASKADYLVCECSFPDSMTVNGHMTPKLAARVAKEAEIKKLILTHFYPEVENEPIVEIINKEFSGKVILGSDLSRFEL